MVNLEQRLRATEINQSKDETINRLEPDQLCNEIYSNTKKEKNYFSKYGIARKDR